MAQLGGMSGLAPNPGSGSGDADQRAPENPNFLPFRFSTQNQRREHDGAPVYPSYTPPYLHHRDQACYPPPARSTWHPGADPPGNTAETSFTVDTDHTAQSAPYIDHPHFARSSNSNDAGWPTPNHSARPLHAAYIPPSRPITTMGNIQGEIVVAGHNLVALGQLSDVHQSAPVYWLPQDMPHLVSPLPLSEPESVPTGQSIHQVVDHVYVPPHSPHLATVFQYFPRVDDSRAAFLIDGTHIGTLFRHHMHPPGLDSEAQNAPVIVEPEENEDTSINDATSNEESDEQSMGTDQDQESDCFKRLLADFQRPDNEEIRNRILRAFPSQPRRQLLAFYILTQTWCENDEMEPALDDNDPFVVSGVLSPGATTRFEYFHESTQGHLCFADDQNGPCDHRCSRRDRAAAHARAHFEYRPFACNGACKKNGCLERYTSLGLLADHVNRKKKPKKQCEICEKVLTRQNLRRHITTLHPDAVQQEVVQVAQPVSGIPLQSVPRLRPTTLPEEEKASHNAS
ncbi:hypothetical protein PIIN_07251 [Serendipita indica DSM 11827]|uniref:Uncharacterized protein n=1 Tax=Serendipita indica (strain DSM 11827) TaxID=1109443 RepID=G4TPQ3_SERID|nr:hypothetical protein PIIN_07251 [Serendipita indica DSM 11827]